MHMLPVAQKLVVASWVRLTWWASNISTVGGLACSILLSILGGIPVNCLTKQSISRQLTNMAFSNMWLQLTASMLQDTGVNVFAGQPGMASTDFFNPKKFDILKIGAVTQYLAQKVIGLTPAQGAAPCIMCCLMAPEDLVGKLPLNDWLVCMNKPLMVFTVVSKRCL